MPVCGSSNLAPGTDPVPGAIQARAWSFQADQKHPISHTSPAHAAQRRPHCPDFCPYYGICSQITELADVFVFSRKEAESTKFPAFFPTTREFGTPNDCRIEFRCEPPRPTVWNGACSKNRHHALGRVLI